MCLGGCKVWLSVCKVQNYTVNPQTTKNYKYTIKQLHHRTREPEKEIVRARAGHRDANHQFSEATKKYSKITELCNVNHAIPFPPLLSLRSSPFFPLACPLFPSSPSPLPFPFPSLRSGICYRKSVCRLSVRSCILLSRLKFSRLFVYTILYASFLALPWPSSLSLSSSSSFYCNKAWQNAHQTRKIQWKVSELKSIAMPRTSTQEKI